MDKILKGLINKAYSLFPLSIRENERVYKESVEFRTLVESIEKNKADKSSQWRELLKELSKVLDEDDLDEIPYREIDRCFMAQIYISYERESKDIVNEEKFLFFISLLIPYYSLCKSINRYDRSRISSFRKRDFDINHDCKLIVALERCINKHFKGYQRFPTEYISVVLPGIEVDTSSILVQQPTLNNAINMTLFHAYFTTNLI